MNLTPSEQRAMERFFAVLAEFSAGIGGAAVGVAVVKGFQSLDPMLLREFLNGDDSVNRDQEAIIPSEQPVEAIRILFAPNLVPETAAAGTSGLGERGLFEPFETRAYVLNTALGRRLPDGSLANAPHFVDFVDLADFSFAERVDLDSDLETFAAPQDMALSNDGKTIVVAVRGTDTRFDTLFTPIESHLTIVDVETAQRVRRILLPERHWPSSVVLSPDGNLAYVLASERLEEDLGRVVSLLVLTIDLASGGVLHTVELPFQDTLPGEIVITPDGGLLFARIPTGIYVIDTASQTLAANIPATSLLNAPLKLAMSPLGHEVYAEGRRPGEFPIGIVVIDVPTAKVKDVLPVPNTQGGARQDVGVSSGGSVLFHLDARSGLLTLIDRLTGGVIDQIDTGEPVFQGAIAEGG